MLRRAITAAAIVATASTTLPAAAATWVGNRTTPSLREIIAVDATGETDWPYGQEDVAGDGLANFKLPEQSIDFRTAYAATDASNFWLRTYVSAADAVGPEVTVYVFVDADANSATGGSANAIEANALLTNDPTVGGYEYVVGIRSNGTIENVWQWRKTPAPAGWQVVAAGNDTRVAETGKDLDPIRVLTRQHGYLQAKIALTTLGLTSVCNAHLYVRSVNKTAGLGNGDLDVGKASACVSVDSNGDHVPDIVVPPSGCTNDSQCPQNGVCENGKCIVAPPCVTTADCSANQQCTNDGRCVPQGGGACTSNDQCNGLVCASGKCAPCTAGGNECGPDNRCAPDGRCVAGPATGDGGNGDNGDADGGIALEPGERVVGGAFHCSAGRAGGSELAVLVLMGAAAIGTASRRRRSSTSSKARE
ncbi:hypothetical protein [Labilithrix luteola]|nr:hypothetical protein [Labilithrix luteola]